MSSEVVMYVEMDAFCAIYIAIMVINMWRSKAASSEDHAFFMGAVSIFVLLLTDMAASIFNGRPGQGFRILLYVINTVYFVFTAIASYACLLYVDYILTENSKQVDDRRVMYVVPCAALVVLSLASNRYGFIFYIDSANYYTRGALHMVQQIITTLYFAMAECYAVACLIKAKNFTRRSFCVKVTEFTTVPLLGLLLQIAFPSASIIWPMSSVALFIMFTYSQNSLISMDALTGLNNRSRLIKYMAERCENSDGRQELTCIVYDIDNFKSINDRYGHSVGDETICQVAGLIKKSVIGVDGSHFIARYTGNSFSVVSMGDKNEDETLIKNFNDLLDEVNGSSKNKFNISVSIGDAVFEKTSMNSEELLKLADDAMYKNKAKTMALRQKKSVEDVVK